MDGGSGGGGHALRLSGPVCHELGKFFLKHGNFAMTFSIRWGELDKLHEFNRSFGRSEPVLEGIVLQFAAV